MLSKNKIKLINSLKIKKYRQKHSLFLCEGTKSCEEFLQSGYLPHTIIHEKGIVFSESEHDKAEIIQADRNEIKKISSFKAPPELAVVFHIPPTTPIPQAIRKETILYCDGIQDPGNLGTILRTAAWFGIDRVVCSEDTADIYNPKTIQAAMGATAKIPVHYSAPKHFFDRSLQIPSFVFGADMQGRNIYSAELPDTAVIIMGNEGRGIRTTVAGYITHRLHIPNFAKAGQNPESLNVAAATAVIFSEFKRRRFNQ